MARKNYWAGFAAGAAVGAAAGFASWLVSKSIGRQEYRKILRLEKSIQIGRPVEEVFRAWNDLERLPDHLSMIEQVHVRGDRSHWRGSMAGRPVEWDAEITQHIPNQAVGWKSLSGPKPTGRVDFSRLGNDALVHVVINYQPKGGILARGLAETFGPLEGYVEQALRDFKSSLEGKGQEDKMAPGRAAEQYKATGTYGDTGNPGMQTSRYGGETPSSDLNNPVDYTRPPKAGS